MTETRYLPTDWLDEIIPTPQSTPDAFAQMDGAPGHWRLRPPQSDYEHHARTLTRPIASGDRVDFSQTRLYPKRTLTVADDGSWSLDQPAPDDANCFMLDGDFDTISDNLEGLVTGHGEPAYALDPGTYTIVNYHWSDPIPFCFAPEGNTPRFVRETVQ